VSISRQRYFLTRGGTNDSYHIDTVPRCQSFYLTGKAQSLRNHEDMSQPSVPTLVGNLPFDADKTLTYFMTKGNHLSSIFMGENRSKIIIYCYIKFISQNEVKVICI
jgi:hypothetical protein